MTGEGPPDPEDILRDPSGYWRVLRDLVLLAALGIVSYVALAIADPEGLVRGLLRVIGPSDLQALLAALLVVALAVAFLTWRRSLEMIRQVEERTEDRNRLENLAKLPRLHPDPLIVVDLDGGITFLNQAAEETFEDLPDAGLVHPVFTPLREHLGQGLDIERERVIETEIELDQGVFEAKAWFDTGEGAARLYLHDVTEHRRLEKDLRESRERLEQVTEHIEEVFWMTDPETEEMLYVSPAYESVWGRSTESLYEDPSSWREAVHPDDRADVEASLEKQAEGEYDEEYRIVRPDGEVRWIRDRAFPVTGDDGEVTRVVGVAADITQEREAFDRLTDAFRREKLLVDIIGHDVSNLLTRALPRLDLLEREDPDLADEIESVREPIERATDVLEQATLLLRLEMDEVDSGDHQRLGNLVQDVVGGVSHLADEEAVEIRHSNHLDRDPLVDPLVGRALENLLENAIEWSAAEDPVELEVVEADPGVEVRVVDHGPGLSDDVREALGARLGPDGRPAEEEDDAEALGLGLPISLRIMERVGGGVRWEGTPGGGTTAVLELPREPGHDVAEGTAVDPDPAAAGDAP